MKIAAAKDSRRKQEVLECSKNLEQGFWIRVQGATLQERLGLGEMAN